MQWQWQLADASTDRRRSVVDALGALAHARHEPVRRVTRVLLDTFDERLADAGLVLEVERRKRATPLLMLRGEQVAQPEHWYGETLPRTARDIQRPRLAARVARVTEDRALLPVCSVTGAVYRVQWFDALDKRIGDVEVFHVMPRHTAPALLFVDIKPVRGFEQACARLLARLRRGVLAEASAIETARALRAQRGGARYRAKPVVELHGRRPANEALAALFAAYGEVLWANERGILEDLDAEFLHDYRVALRSLRSWVGDLRRVLARPARARVKAELAALNRVTGRVRDLDVLRAALPDHLAALGGVDAAQATRLGRLVEDARNAARHQLHSHLHGSAYRKFRHRWRQLCRRLAAGRGLGRDGESALREVVTAAIGRRLRDILAFDWADAEREPALLHELRKECKKLRYLLEGFQTLFDHTLCRRAIAELKSVQTAMGDTWDLHVHHALLQDLGAGLEPADARTVLLIVVGLGTRLTALEHAHVELVAQAYARFRSASVQRIYRRLLEQP